MRYGSVCSGIEAATVAWHPLGWTPAWFSEIGPFPSSLLAHHYPKVRNHGTLSGLALRLVGEDRSIGLLVGGTPCQAFSSAGLRLGLADERSNLALEYCRVADALRPPWVLWENVSGALDSNGGRDFGSILGALADIGYGLAWRVLDARYFGVPQARRRVFLVGRLGSSASAGAVLFEPEGRVRDVAASSEEWAPRAGLAPDGTPRVCEAVAKTLMTGQQSGRVYTENLVVDGGRARRLTAVEAERVQGFPDHYTDTPGSSLGSRWEALGNSMAVPVMRWIGQRIAKVDALTSPR